ncbi:conserved Plasmodium protein, unknown function [Plasmodium vivax]|uniref:Uncharacterized protein n=1 Tax=Plasmodium vivax TaxID=5855 RepID=A0A564ZXE0_PLAVI|nr:conserved Plasmodium protein, unknown function [Plasmodium vivax]
MSRFSLQKIVFNDGKLLSCENAPKDDAPKDDAASFKSLTTSQFRSDKGKSGPPHQRVENPEMKCAPNFEDTPNGASQQKCEDHRSGPPAVNSEHIVEDNKNRGYMNLIKNNVRNVISNIINRKSILGRKNNEDVREDEKKKAGEEKGEGKNSNAALSREKYTSVALSKEKHTSAALSKRVEFPDANGAPPDLKPTPRGTEKKGSTSNWVRSNHENKSSVRKNWTNVKNVAKKDGQNVGKNVQNDGKNVGQNNDSKVNLGGVAKDMIDESTGGKTQLSGRGTPPNEKNRGAEKVSHGDGSRTNRSSKAVNEKARNEVASLSGKGQALISRAPSLTGRTPSLISRAPSLTGRTPSLISRAPSLTSRTPSQTSKTTSLAAKPLAAKPLILGIKKNEKIPNKQNAFTSRTTHNREKYTGRSTSPNFLHNDSFQKNLKKTLIDTIMNPDKGERTPGVAAGIAPRTAPGTTPRTVKTLNRSGHPDLLRRDTLSNQKGFPHGDKTKSVIKYPSPINANSAREIGHHTKGDNLFETKQQMIRRYSTAVRNRNSVLRKNSVTANGHLSLYKLNGEGNEKKKLSSQPNGTPKVMSSTNDLQAPENAEWTSREGGEASQKDLSPVGANYKNKVAPKLFPLQRKKIDGLMNSFLKNGRPVKETSPTGGAKCKNSPTSKQGTQKWGLHKRVGGNNEPPPLHMPKRFSTMNFTRVNKECAVPSRTLKRFDSVAKGQVKKGVDLKTGYKLDTGMRQKRFSLVSNLEKVGHAHSGVKSQSRCTSEGDDVDDERGSLPSHAVKGEQIIGEVEHPVREAPLEGGDQRDAMELPTGEALLEGGEKSDKPEEHTPGGVLTGDEAYYNSSAVNSAQTKYRETDLYENYNDTTMMVLKRNLDYGEETPRCVTPMWATQGGGSGDPDEVGPGEAEREEAEPEEGQPDEATPDEATPDEANQIGPSPMAPSDRLSDAAQKSSGVDARENHQSDGLRTLLGGEVAQFCTAEETFRGDEIDAAKGENDKVDDSDREFITLVKGESFLKDRSSDSLISYAQMEEVDKMPVKEEQKGEVLIRGDSRDGVKEEGSNYGGENGEVAEIGQCKKSDYVCIRVESEDEDLITENVKFYLKSKSQEDGFKAEWGGGGASKGWVASQGVKSDENVSAKVTTGQVGELAASHEKRVILEGEHEEGMIPEGEHEEGMTPEGEHEESSFPQHSDKGNALLPPHAPLMGGTDPPETHHSVQLPSGLSENNNTPQILGGRKSGARGKSSAICGDDQSSVRGSHLKAPQICGKHSPRRRNKMVRKKNMYNFCSKYKRNYNLSLDNRKGKERKVASHGGENEQVGTHAERGSPGEGAIVGGEAYPGAQQGNLFPNEGLADQFWRGGKRKIGKLLKSVATPSWLVKKRKAKPSSPVKSRSPGGLKCRVRKSRGGEGRRKRKGGESKRGDACGVAVGAVEEVEKAAEAADGADGAAASGAPAAQHAEAVFREHEWMRLILQIIDKGNFELAEKLMLLIFEKEEELYRRFVDVERSDASTRADSSPPGRADEPNGGGELSGADESNAAGELRRADDRKNSSTCTIDDAPQQRKKEVSHYMEQIMHSCPADWPLLDIAILIIVSQIVCHIFTHNKWRYFFQSCVLFEQFCIAILLNSSIINSEKNGIPILMFEHDFFCKIVTTGNGELSSTAVKYRCEYLKNDHVGKEMTILDVIFLALASYITVSQNLNEYVERNNLAYYLDLFRKRARERGVQEERRKGKKRRPSNRSSYAAKKQRFSEPLQWKKPTEEQHLFERTKRRRMTYEKNVKRRLSILRTAKCITAGDKHSVRRRSACLDPWHGKEIPKGDGENRKEDNQGNKFFLFRNKKIETIVQYHTRSHLEKMLCHIVIEIFNLVYAFGEYSVENVLIIRKFFRVFLNFAQKRFVALSVRAHSESGSGSGGVIGGVIDEVWGDLGSELRATATAGTTAGTSNCGSVRGAVPPPQRIYDNYHNVWIWVERIFSQNFCELNNLLYNVGLERSSLGGDDHLSVNYAKIETISKNVKRFSALQRRNCCVLRRYWATFGSKEGVAASGERDIEGAVCDDGNGPGTTPPRSPLERFMEEAPTGLASHEWLPNGELDKENLRKHRILCKLEKRDHSKDRLTFHFLSVVECIYNVYHSMEEIPSFLHLKKKKYFSNYMGSSSEKENGKESTGMPFLNGPTNEQCDLSRSYSSPSQVVALLNHHMGSSNNCDKGVVGDAQMGKRTSEAEEEEEAEEKTDHWVRQLKRRLKIYDIQWHEDYEKQYVNLASCMKRLKKRFREKKIFCKIMESDLNSFWLDKNQVYLQYIQITINCKFILGCSYDEIFKFVKGNYAFVLNMVEEMRRGCTGSASPPPEGEKKNFLDDNFLLMAWEIANFYFCILYYKFELKEILQELLKWVSIFRELELQERGGRGGCLLTYRQRCVSYSVHILIFLNEYTCAQRVLKRFSREFLRGDCSHPSGGIGLLSGINPLGGVDPLDPRCAESRPAVAPTCERAALHAHTINKCYLYDKWINFMIRKYNRLIPFLLEKKNFVKLILFNNRNVKILLKKKKEKVIIKKVMRKMQQLQRVVLSLYCLCVKLYKGYYDHASILHFQTARQLLVASKYLGIHIKERAALTSYFPPGGGAADGADGPEGANGTDAADAADAADAGGVKMGRTLLHELPYHGASNNFLSADDGGNLFPGRSFGDAMGASPAAGRAASEWASPGLYLRAESATPHVSPHLGNANRDGGGENGGEKEGGQNSDDMFHLHALILSIQIQYTLSVCIIICADLFISPAKLNRLAGGRRANKDPPAVSKPKHPTYVRSLFNCKILRKHYRVINGHDFAKGKGSNGAKRRRKKKKKKKKKKKEPLSCGGMGLSGPMHMYYVDYAGGRRHGKGFSSGVGLQTDKKLPHVVQHAGNLRNHGEEPHVGDGSKDSPTDCWQDHPWSNQPDRDCLSDVGMERTRDSLEGGWASPPRGCLSGYMSSGYLNGCYNGRFSGYLSECLPGRYENFKRSILKKRGSNLGVREGKLKENGGDCAVRTSGPDPVDARSAYHILVQISTWLSKNSAAQLAWIGQKLFKMCLPELLCIVLALQANMFMGRNILTNIKRIDRILKLCAESPQLVYFATESLKNHRSKANRKTYKNYFSIGRRYKEIFEKRKRDVINSKEELFQLCKHLLPCDGVDKGDHTTTVQFERGSGG